MSPTVIDAENTKLNLAYALSCKDDLTQNDWLFTFNALIELHVNVVGISVGGGFSESMPMVVPLRSDSGTY